MERLQKFIARCGVASRRKAEAMISAGRVMVNGKIVTELGVKVDPEQDKIRVDGEEIRIEADQVYILLHKPEGYVTTVSDPRGRLTVLDLIIDSPSLHKVRLFPVGRLDFNTTGLLILTNDGALAYALTHPSHQVDKTYEAWVQGVPAERGLKALREGILLEDGITAPAKVEILKVKEGNARLRLIIHEGRKRQVRRMCQAIGHPVRELKRIAFGPLGLGRLKPGAYRTLSAKELSSLKAIEEAVTKKGETDAPDKKG